LRGRTVEASVPVRWIDPDKNCEFVKSFGNSTGDLGVSTG